MLFEISDETDLKRHLSTWNPAELELEKLIISSDAEIRILDSAIFGEPLLVIKNQVSTRHKKRADILAMDQHGNAVIVELKRDTGYLGVETQALQYLADFSAYKGLDFIENFSKYDNQLEEKINSFLNGKSLKKDINKSSRVILVARDFDPAIYSMGEWLSNNGIAFRCIQYTPTEINDRKLISFSIAFDRSKDILNPLVFGRVSREPNYYWHNIASPAEGWWNHLRTKKQIPACFDSLPGDAGEKLLKNYIAGDIIIAYAKGHGAIGWGIIEDPKSYHLASIGSEEDYWKDGDCMHRLSINWKVTAKKLSEGIPPSEIRDRFNLYHPLSTSVYIDPFKAKQLIDALNTKLTA